MPMSLSDLLDSIQLPVSPDEEIPPTPAPTEFLGWVSLKDRYGGVGNGNADDTAAFQDAFDDLKVKGYGLYVDAGHWSLTSAPIWARPEDPPNMAGLVVRGLNPMSSIIVNASTSGGPAFDLSTGGLNKKYQFFGSISDLGFEDAGAGPNSHAIQYRSCWHQTFRNLRFSGLNGAGLRAVNTAADADASSQVIIDNVFALDCQGPAFDTSGSTGGVALHSLRQVNAINCGVGGAAYVVLDGCIQLSMDMCSMSGTGTASPLVHIKSTNVRARQIKITGGEYGNNCGTHFKVDAVSTLHVDGIRHVRRRTEPNSTIGFDFADGVSLYSGIKIENCELQIDAPHAIGHPDYVALPAWTWMKLGTGLDIGGSFEAGPPNKSSFASGNVTYAFTSDEAKLRPYRLAEADGRDIRSPRTKRQRVPFNAPGSIVPDLSQGDFYQALLNVSGAFTVQPPIGGQGDSQRMVLTIFKDGSNTITWAAAYEAPTVPTNGGTFAFIYDSASAIWRLVR